MFCSEPEKFRKSLRRTPIRTKSEKSKGGDSQVENKKQTGHEIETVSSKTEEVQRDICVRVSSRIYPENDPLSELINNDKFQGASASNKLTEIIRTLQADYLRDQKKSEKIVTTFETAVRYAMGDLKLTEKDVHSMNQYQIEAL